MEKDFVCQYCGQVFDSGYKLGGHKVWCEPFLIDKYGSVENAQQIKRIKYIKATQPQRDAKKQEWDSVEHYCENCGKQFFEKYASGRFCCKECAKSFSSSKDDSKETKPANCIICGEPILINKRQSIKKCLCCKCRDLRYHSERKIIQTQNVLVPRFCSTCGKKISSKNISGMCRHCYSHRPLSEERKKKQSETMKNKQYPRWHIHRNKRSFPEKFFETVLNNNEIPYLPEYQVLNQSGHYYSLDFFVEVGLYKVDLEIDGKQHLYRAEDDSIRDEFLTGVGYTVYRIPWNDIKNDSGKQLMKQKIDAFLEFYENLKG